MAQSVEYQTLDLGCHDLRVLSLSRVSAWNPLKVLSTPLLLPLSPPLTFSLILFKKKKIATLVPSPSFPLGNGTLGLAIWTEHVGRGHPEGAEHWIG